MPDADLLQQYRQSANLEVLGLLYQRYMDLVYGVCLKYLKQPDDAKDSVLLIFEELIGKLQKHEVSNFKSWLHQVAKNHCLMRLRSEKNKKMLPLDESVVQYEENVHLNGALEKEENYQRMHRCLEKLADGQKQAIELFYLKGKCYQEIAAQTGLDWNQVRSNIQNGRRNLKLCMEKQQTNLVKNG